MTSANLETLANSVLAWTAAYFSYSTVLLAGTWLALAISRTRSPFLQEWAWKWAALAGVVTASAVQFAPGRTTFVAWPEDASEVRSAESPASNRLERSPPPLAAGSALPQEFTMETARLEPSNSSPPPRLTAVLHAILPSPPKPPQLKVAATSRKFSWPLIVGGAIAAWLIGATLVAIIGAALTKVSLASRLARSGACHDKRARAILDSLCRASRLRRPVRLRVCNGAIEPAAYGWFRPTITLPRELLSLLSDDELRALLAHELAHIVRHDAVWLWVGRLLCSTLVFQPLNGLARRRWRQAAELRCDAWALEAGARRISLARCLATAAEWLGGRKTSPQLAATGSPFVARVNRLLNDETHDRWASPARRRLLASLLMGATLVVFSLAPAFATSARTEPTSPTPDAEVEPRRSGNQIATIRSDLYRTIAELDRAADLGRVAGMGAEFEQSLVELQVRCALAERQLAEWRRRDELDER